MSTRVYADYELRELLVRYVRDTALDAEVASVLVPTVRMVLEQRDEARARCVELLGPRKSGPPPRVLAWELQTALVELQAAASEPCLSPSDNRLIDAMRSLLAYVALLPPPPAPLEPDRDAILTDAKAIAERHGVNVGLLCDRIEVHHRDGIHLSERETLFLADLLASVGLE